MQAINWVRNRKAKFALTSVALANCAYYLWCAWGDVPVPPLLRLLTPLVFLGAVLVKKLEAQSRGGS
jgi:hypothetical protein